MKLSEQLRRDNESGDFGKALEGYAEQAERLEKQRDDLLAALLKVARMAEDLKRPCGMDPESPQAIRNGEYMNISYAARAAIASVKEK